MIRLIAFICLYLTCTPATIKGTFHRIKLKSSDFKSLFKIEELKINENEDIVAKFIKGKIGLNISDLKLKIKEISARKNNNNHLITGTDFSANLMNFKIFSKNITANIDHINLKNTQIKIAKNFTAFNEHLEFLESDELLINHETLQCSNILIQLKNFNFKAKCKKLFFNHQLNNCVLEEILFYNNIEELNISKIKIAQEVELEKIIYKTNIANQTLTIHSNCAKIKEQIVIFTDKFYIKYGKITLIAKKAQLKNWKIEIEEIYIYKDEKYSGYAKTGYLDINEKKLVLEDGRNYLNV